MYIFKVSLIFIFLITMVTSSVWKHRLIVSGKSMKLLKVRHSNSCYSCGCVINDEYKSSMGLMTTIFSFKIEDMGLCKSCNRNLKISYLQNKKEYFSIIFKKLILSSLQDKLLLLMLVNISLLLISLIINSRLLLDITSISNYILLIIYWSLSLVQNYYVSKFPL